jgi:FtsH-binding integral membrane protein
MKTEDRGRTWMWLFLGLVVALKFYFVQELIAAFVLFTFGFAAIAFVILSLYILQKGWEVAVARFTETQHLSGPGLQARRAAREMP